MRLRRQRFRSRLTGDVFHGCEIAFSGQRNALAAPRMIAVVAEPGMPSVSIGTMAPATAALFADPWPGNGLDRGRPYILPYVDMAFGLST